MSIQSSDERPSYRYDVNAIHSWSHKYGLKKLWVWRTTFLSVVTCDEMVWVTKMLTWFSGFRKCVISYTIRYIFRNRVNSRHNALDLKRWKKTCVLSQRSCSLERDRQVRELGNIYYDRYCCFLILFANLAFLGWGHHSAPKINHTRVFLLNA